MSGGFVVIRHAETDGIGTSPVEALETVVPNGWRVVSDVRVEPAAFELAEFAEAPETDQGRAYRHALADAAQEAAGVPPLVDEADEEPPAVPVDPFEAAMAVQAAKETTDTEPSTEDGQEAPGAETEETN